MPHIKRRGRNAQKPDWRHLPAYTVTEAARYLGLSPRTLRRRRTGLLTFAGLIEAVPAAERSRCVEVNQYGTPVRFYPPYPGRGLHRVIAIDPRIAFGRPIVLRTGVSARVIDTRIRNGERFRDIAADYGLTAAEIRQALLFERATRLPRRATRLVAASTRKARQGS